MEVAQTQAPRWSLQSILTARCFLKVEFQKPREEGRVSLDRVLSKVSLHTRKDRLGKRVWNLEEMVG